MKRWYIADVDAYHELHISTDLGGRYLLPLKIMLAPYAALVAGLFFLESSMLACAVAARCVRMRVCVCVVLRAYARTHLHSRAHIC